jgi:hypothetical protein
MRKELEKQLYEKYPKIFRQKDLPKEQSLMRYGFACHEGWYDLIDALCACIQSHVDSQCRMEEYKKKRQDPDESEESEVSLGEPKNFQVEAVQVKQKFGSLRFYTDGSDDYVRGLINMASCISYRTCEKCGSTNGVKQTTGWIMPLCKKCYRKWIIERAISKVKNFTGYYRLKTKYVFFRAKYFPNEQDKKWMAYKAEIEKKTT